MLRSDSERRCAGCDDGRSAHSSHLRENPDTVGRATQIKSAKGQIRGEVDWRLQRERVICSIELTRSNIYDCSSAHDRYRNGRALGIGSNRNADWQRSTARMRQEHDTR